MTQSILYTDTPEHFYQELQEIIKNAIRQELIHTQKASEEIEYIKKEEVCRMLQVSKPTVDSHIKKGYYKKHYLGSRIFFNKQEILSYLAQSAKPVKTHSKR